MHTAPVMLAEPPNKDRLSLADPSGNVGVDIDGELSSFIVLVIVGRLNGMLKACRNRKFMSGFLSTGRSI